MAQVIAPGSVHLGILAMNLTMACEPRDERELFKLLKKLPEIKARGLHVRMGERCGVVIASGVHIRAIWHAGCGDFDLIPAGYSVPQIVVHTLTDVETATLEFLENSDRAAPAVKSCACSACQ